MSGGKRYEALKYEVQVMKTNGLIVGMKKQCLSFFWKNQKRSGKKNDDFFSNSLLPWGYFKYNVNYKVLLLPRRQ
jgi:hypothetical protein